MQSTRFLMLAAAVFAYFGLILLSLLIAFPYGMIALVAIGGMALLSIEALMRRRQPEQDNPYRTNLG